MSASTALNFKGLEYWRDIIMILRSNASYRLSRVMSGDSEAMISKSSEGPLTPHLSWFPVVGGEEMLVQWMCSSYLSA